MLIDLFVPFEIKLSSFYVVLACSLLIVSVISVNVYSVKSVCFFFGRYNVPRPFSFGYR